MQFTYLLLIKEDLANNVKVYYLVETLLAVFQLLLQFRFQPHRYDSARPDADAEGTTAAVSAAVSPAIAGAVAAAVVAAETAAAAAADDAVAADAAHHDPPAAAVADGVVGRPLDAFVFVRQPRLTTVDTISKTTRTT